MMSSMRLRLFLILVGTTGIVWLSAAAWIFFSTRAEVERVLDARLVDAAEMVSTLMSGQQISAAAAAQSASRGGKSGGVYFSHQLSCQIWSIEGKLISKSEGAPNDRFSSEATGFSQSVIEGEEWRVYAVENPDAGIRVLVGDSVKVRDALIGDVAKGFIAPATLILPVLGGLIWISVSRGMAPLRRVAEGLSRRPAWDLTAIPTEPAPSELSPMIDALNDLFKRVAESRERERNFTAFAAHELRTPLAGLKTQAQIAMASDKSEIRQKALSQIAAGVDRTSRLVRQLLDLSAIEGEDASDNRDPGPINPGALLETLTSELKSHRATATEIDIDEKLFQIRVRMNGELFMLAARNLLENAVNYSPSGSLIECRLIEFENTVAITVDDQGPGIPEGEFPLVTERFFRGRNKVAVGSGLGLSIVATALDHAGASFRLVNRGVGGLSAQIVLDPNMIIAPALEQVLEEPALMEATPTNKHTSELDL